ncbi:unnamed protein product [Haemonchus placei]|uniref:Nudix hydrolase domain-containing protein n=1 Tax=Haemonchus placei TaxID=6290 RepID=A0A0N4WUE5_HAEPC|nr:unnamed protein product [Haemonchus placei]
MTLWLGDEPSRLPPTALSHYSVSGLVFDGTGRVLMVLERCRQNRRVSFWKFPGGVPETNEPLVKTAERKVLEETGVAAKGEAIISLRDEINSLPRDQLFGPDRNVWQAYLESLEDVGGEELYEATDKGVTSKMFNFTFS